MVEDGRFMFRTKPKFNSPMFIEFLRDMQRTMGSTVIVMDNGEDLAMRTLALIHLKVNTGEENLW